MLVFLSPGYMRDLKAVNTHCSVIARRRAENIIPTAHAFFYLFSPKVGLYTARARQGYGLRMSVWMWF